MKALPFALLLFAISAPALAESLSTLVATHNSEIVAQTPLAKDVFVVEADGAVRHLQSRMLCAAGFQNVNFADVQIFPSSPIGLDVGCDYARVGTDGNAVSKLTIFAIKAPEGATLDSVFATYRHDVVSAHPEAGEVPAALQIADPATKRTRTDYRAIGYSIMLDQKRAHSELIVGIVGGWILEVRATYPNSVIQVEKNTTQDDLRNQLFDIQSPYLAFMSARDSFADSRAPR